MQENESSLHLKKKHQRKRKYLQSIPEKREEIPELEFQENAILSLDGYEKTECFDK